MGGLLETILKSQDGLSVEHLARTFGISGSDAGKAISSMLPGLTRGVQQNISSREGLDGLIQALNQGHHRQYLDQPETLARMETVQDGKNILGHILGSKDASRQLASEAAAESGLDAGLLKKMLPIIAAMAMGGLGKQGASLGGVNTSSGDDAGTGSILGALLDADRDGSVADDLLDMARKLF